MIHSLTRTSLGAAFVSVSLLMPAFAESDSPPMAEPGENGVISSEFIYELEGRQTPQCHASTIVETPEGLAAAWFGGTKEKHVDVGIWFSRKVDGAWTKPVELVDGTEGEDQDYPCWNPVLFQPKDGPLLLFYKVGPSAAMWWGKLITSEDNGLTWSEPHKLGTSDQLPSENPHLAGPIKNKPIQLADGSLLCPSSSEIDGWRVHFEVTRDLGKTWEVIGPINDASEFNAIQPSILTYPDNRMQILCRSREEVITQSWSEDGGKTWSKVTATDLPNPNSGTDAVTLKDGRQLLVYNPTIKSKPSGGRNNLALAVSSDGKSWNTFLTLEKMEQGEFSYPAVVQASDGKIHITYTWKRQTVKHVVLDPAGIPAPSL